jgi:hypothetical protein
MSEGHLMLHSNPAPPRVRAPSLSEIHTALVTLPPAFVEAVRAAAGKPRRAKMPYVLALAVFVAAGVLGADRSTREFVETSAFEAKAKIARVARPTTAAPTTEAPPAPTFAEGAVARVPVVLRAVEPAPAVEKAPGASPPIPAKKPLRKIR